MSERPPQEPSAKIESKESAERPPKFRTISDEVLEIHEDGSKTHRVVECNGHTHRRCVDTISYDERGEVTYVDEHSREEIGACDGAHS